jgi:hypothetical protein
MMAQKEFQRNHWEKEISLQATDFLQASLNAAACLQAIGDE